MRTVVILSLLVIASRLAAQSPAPAAQAPAPAVPAATVDVPAPPPPDAKPDLVKQAFELVEVQANTKANLQKAIGLYEQALKDPALPAKDRAAALTDMARAYLRLGDLETVDNAKLGAYENGRAAAKKAMALDPKSADAVFWDMANQATIGRTKGVMNSLFMLPELRKGLGQALVLQPNHQLARQTLGEIDHAVPGIVGGSDERSEKAYLEVLKRDPNFTPTMVLLAKLYRDQGEDEAAKKWAQKALDGKSSVPNDWRKFDKPDAQKLLKELND